MRSTRNRSQPASKDRFQRLSRCVPPLCCRVRGAVGKEEGPLKSLSSRYSQAYANGRSQPWALLFFAPRKGDITVYLQPDIAAHAEQLAQLGPHKTAKVCLYIKQLADIDLQVLAALLQRSVQLMAPLRLL